MDDAGRKYRLKNPGGLIAAALILAFALASAPPAGARQKSRSQKSKTAQSVLAKPVAAIAAPADQGNSRLPGQSAPDDSEDIAKIALIAKGAVLLDAFTGATLYEKNADEVFYPASATKILTALLVIEAGDLDRPVVITPADTKVEPSAIGFKPGEQFTRRELLYALMLKSANDVAQALARDNAGSVAAFAEKMTRRAQQLGATSSHFMNPHGLHNPNHYTTPHDLALIARAAMQQPEFRQFVGTQSYDWVCPRGTVRLQNHNKMLRSYPGCTGLKTGYTVAAQHVLVTAALRNNREVICVVMHSDKPGKWTDSQQLLTYGLEHLPAGPQFDLQ